MIRLIVNGAAGRMGRLIVSEAAEAADFKLVAALEAPGHPEIGSDAGEIAGAGVLGVPVSADPLPEADVLTDFSAPGAATARAEEAAGNGTAVIVATTGLAADQRARIEALAERVAVLISSNMSVGVNLLFDLARRTARLLAEDYDIEIVEAHHRHKKDAPSGTALSLLRAVCEGREWDPDETAVFGRCGQTGERPVRQVGMHAIRGGEIVGDHTVRFIGPAEQIELTHRAQNREIFARGALRVARFMAEQPAGLYTMAQALGL
jgi:4-hydroxy-tetrahydrodipicolinate reductase